MRTFLFTSGFYGLLLMSGVSAVAEPIDQSAYLSSATQQIEKRQHSWPDGRLYDGEWMQDQPHGQGMLTYTDGGQYWGRFQAGKRQGEGLMKFVNGDEYEGEWFDDQPQGKGVFRYADGARHEGMFERGHPSGNGRRTYADGSSYDGQWQQNVPHGFGRLSFSAGGAYEGQFQQGKPHGRGIYYFANGDMYEGEWKNGKQDGSGRFDYATGGFYEGGVTQGRRQGKGVWVSALGQRYEGAFSANQPHGSGRCGTLAKMEPCTWRHGKRVEQPAPVTVAATQPAPSSKPVSATAQVAAVAPVALASAAKPAAAAPAAVKPAPALSQPAAKPAPTLEAKVAPVAVAATTQGSTFTKTLAEEKQRLATPTVADLNQSRSDMFFNDNWTHLDLMAKPGRLWWKKHTSLFQDQLEIVSQYGDTRIRMQIDDYRGPGRYALSQVEVESPSQSFVAEGDEAGEVEILGDEHGWISGEFNFNVQTDNGRALDIRDGVFRISDASRQPNFLR